MCASSSKLLDIGVLCGCSLPGSTALVGPGISWGVGVPPTSTCVLRGHFSADGNQSRVPACAFGILVDQRRRCPSLTCPGWGLCCSATVWCRQRASPGFAVSLASPSSTGSSVSGCLSRQVDVSLPVLASHPAPRGVDGWVGGRSCLCREQFSSSVPGNTLHDPTHSSGAGCSPRCWWRWMRIPGLLLHIKEKPPVGGENLSFLNRCIDLFKKERERKKKGIKDAKERKRQVFHLLIHSSDGCNSPGSVRLKAQELSRPASWVRRQHLGRLLLLSRACSQQLASEAAQLHVCGVTHWTTSPRSAMLRACCGQMGHPCGRACPAPDCLHCALGSFQSSGGHALICSGEALMGHRCAGCASRLWHCPAQPL